MQFVNINDKPPTYSFIDEKCIGRKCFHPVITSKSAGSCGYRMNHGCPDPLFAYVKDTAARHKADGWKLKK